MKNLILLVLVFLLFYSCGSEGEENNERSNSDQTTVETARLDSIRRDLEAAYAADQDIRGEIMNQETFDGNKVTKMVAIDSANQVYALRYLEDQGRWPHQSELGETATDAVFYIIQHADVSIIVEYLPWLQAAAAEGEAKSTHAAMMEDRMLMYQGKKQRYGTQARTDEQSGQAYIWPIEDATNVNARREAMGFETTVEEYAEQLNASYDSDRELN